MLITRWAINREQYRGWSRSCVFDYFSFYQNGNLLIDFSKCLLDNSSTVNF